MPRGQVPNQFVQERGERCELEGERATGTSSRTWRGRSSLGSSHSHSSRAVCGQPSPWFSRLPRLPAHRIPCRTQARPRGRFCCAFLELFGAFIDEEIVPLAPRIWSGSCPRPWGGIRVQRSPRSDVVTGGAHYAVEFVWNLVVFFFGRGFVDRCVWFYSQFWLWRVRICKRFWI